MEIIFKKLFNNDVLLKYSSNSFGTFTMTPEELHTTMDVSRMYQKCHLFKVHFKQNNILFLHKIENYFPNMWMESLEGATHAHPVLNVPATFLKRCDPVNSCKDKVIIKFLLKIWFAVLICTELCKLSIQGNFVSIYHTEFQGAQWEFYIVKVYNVITC